MRSALLILLLLLQSAPPAPILVGATFTSSTSAAVWWEQPADPLGLTHTCLIRIYPAPFPAGICLNDLPAGPQRIDLPGDLTDPAYRPAYGDRFLLQINGVTVGQATLGEAEVHTLYLALVQHSRAPPLRLVYLPRI